MFDSYIGKPFKLDDVMKALSSWHSGAPSEMYKRIIIAETSFSEEL
jgi:hypothetical protein